MLSGLGGGVARRSRGFIAGDGVDAKESETESPIRVVVGLMQPQYMKIIKYYIDFIDLLQYGKS